RLRRGLRARQRGPPTPARRRAAHRPRAAPRHRRLPCATTGESLMTARTVMITGAAGNLGRAVAQAFARSGDTLVLVDRSRAALDQAFGEEGPQRLLLEVDLLQQPRVDEAVAQVAARCGGVDVLCNL